MASLFGTIIEGENTKYEREILSDNYGIKWDKDFEINDNTYPIDGFIDKNIFLEGVAAYLGLASDDTEQIIREVERRYKEQGIEFTKTVRQWLQGKKKPSQAQHYRYNCYDFCLALGMDITETASFMFKYFQVMPFNYKNREDAIYYYCIKHNKSYATIKEMRSIASNFPATNGETKNTCQIGERISEISDDIEFMDYLKYNCYDDEHQFATARKVILELMDVCKEQTDITSNSKLSMEISGYNNQIGMNQGRVDKGISKSELPPEFTTSFPDDGVIGKVIKGKYVSDESLRKLLVLLKFYSFFNESERAIDSNEDNINEKEEAENKIRKNWDDFEEECNDLLATCGYVQLYPRNAFDWHIFVCANSKYPIDVFKSLIKQLYADKMCE